jgi:tetratricopeptide (TPR) repeat protein
LKFTIARLVSILLLSICFLAFRGYAYELPAAEQDKISAAWRLAARVYQETGDAAGAVKVLEEAGVARLEKGRPDNMPVKAYLDAIEAYAGYLARTAEADNRAAEYLKIVIKNDPSRTSAYRNLGELYYRRFQRDTNPQYRRIYEQAYAKYVERLLVEGVRAVLPQHIIQAVYPQSREVCLLVRNLHERSRLRDLDILFNAEHDISELNLSDPEGVYTSLGPSFSGFLQSVSGAITRSSVDIDNDGTAELRFRALAANGCQRDLFYKQFGTQTALLSNTLLDEYYRGRRICTGDLLQIVRVNNTNYLLEVKQRPDLQSLQLIELRPSGEHLQHCHIAPPTTLERNLVTDCQAAICKFLAGNIDKIIAADGQVGKEWLVGDVSGQVFAPGVIADTALKPFIESPHQYLADINNDGEDELIARLWQAQAGGKLEYQYRLFKMQDKQWAPWTLPAPDKGTGPGPWQWFFIESFENDFYIVAYTAGKGVDADSKPIMSYKLAVYHLSQNQLTNLGELRTRGDPQPTDIGSVNAE